MTRPRSTEKEASGAWLKIGLYRSSTLLKLDRDVEWAWFRLQFFSAEDDNGGVIPRRDLPTAFGRKIGAKKMNGLLAELADIGLIEDHTDRVVLPRFGEENPPADTWHDEVKRHRWQRGKALTRNGDLCRQIKTRDRHQCRYCGIRVNWDNKNGRTGGTYDHIDPDGDNSIDNVVVACRGCNSDKRDRTVEEWIASSPRHGRTLKRPGTTAAQAEAIDQRRWEEFE